MSKKDFPPIHPGEMLMEEFLKPMGISQYRLAKSINVPARRINEIVHGKPPAVLGKRAISADAAFRLGRFRCHSLVRHQCTMEETETLKNEN